MSKDYTGRKYNIVPYDPDWINQFDSKRKILSEIFEDRVVSFEHVGSTAVPGLAGKPVIDILVLVDDITTTFALNQKMESAGFKNLGEYVMPGSRLFVEESGDTRLVNIHVFPKNHPHVKEMLDLRNYLRSHTDTVKEYSKLKSDLYAKYPNDYGEYRKQKDEWMNNLKEQLTRTI